MFKRVFFQLGKKNNPTQRRWNSEKKYKNKCVILPSGNNHFCNSELCKKPPVLKKERQLRDKGGAGSDSGQRQRGWAREWGVFLQSSSRPHCYKLVPPERSSTPGTPRQHRLLQVTHRQGVCLPLPPGPCASVLPSGFHSARHPYGHVPPHSAQTLRWTSLLSWPGVYSFVVFSLTTASLRTSADTVQHLFNQLPSPSGLGFVAYYLVLI